MTTNYWIYMGWFLFGYVIARGITWVERWLNKRTKLPIGHGIVDDVEGPCPQKIAESYGGGSDPAGLDGPSYTCERDQTDDCKS